jgi:hypothetical protein
MSLPSGLYWTSVFILENVCAPAIEKTMKDGAGFFVAVVCFEFFVCLFGFFGVLSDFFPFLADCNHA